MHKVRSFACLLAYLLQRKELLLMLLLLLLPPLRQLYTQEVGRTGADAAAKIATTYIPNGLLVVVVAVGREEKKVAVWI